MADRDVARHGGARRQMRDIILASLSLGGGELRMKWRSWLAARFMNGVHDGYSERGRPGKAPSGMICGARRTQT
jgi:hypothetical protein